MRRLSSVLLLVPCHRNTVDWGAGLTYPAHRLTQETVAPEKIPIIEGATNLSASIRCRTWLYGTLALVFLRALPNVRYPLGRDHATFCVIGQGLLHGQLLYRDLWDNKPPGIFYIYAVIVKIFGPVMWSVGVVDILWLLVISCCIFYFSSPLTWERRAPRWQRSSTPAGIAARGTSMRRQPETFLMLCVFAAWFLLRDQDPLPALVLTNVLRKWRNRLDSARYFGWDLMLGAAFWLKYNAVAFFPFLALLPFVDFRDLDYGAARLRFLIPWKDWLGRMLIVAAGLVFAVAAVFAGFLISGAWPAMKEIQFEVLPRYGAMAFHGSFSFPPLCPRAHPRANGDMVGNHARSHFALCVEAS